MRHQAFPHSRSRSKTSFTLIELLVVVAIIFILALIVLQSVKEIKCRARCLGRGILYWKLDDGAGEVALDSSGGAQDGKINGATWVTEGLQGPALMFDGVDDYVVCRGLTKDMYFKNYTLEVWVKWLGGPQDYIITKGGSGADDYNFRLLVYADGTVYGNHEYGGSAGDVNIYSTTKLTPGTWYYIALTYDGTDMKLFINGKVEATTSDSHLPGDGKTPNPEPIRVGQNGELDSPFHGLLNEVRIWRCARCPCYIEKAYREYAPN